MSKRIAGKNCFRVLILTLLAIIFMAMTAFAENAGSVEEMLSLIEAGEGTIVLTDDIELTQTIAIGRSADIVIDLNGHQLTRAENLGTMFAVNGGKLTITDSKAAAARERMLMQQPPRDKDASDGTGIALPSSLKNGVLTYYESRSMVWMDRISTMEFRYENTVNVDNMGGVRSSNGSNAALFQVSGSDSVLDIQGGAFTNPTGRVIEANGGATLNITGGYFYHSTAGNGMGGAVYANGYSGKVTINIGGAWMKEAVFAGNSGANGGALATEGKVELNIHNGAVFTGNKATGEGRNGGGAIYVGYDGEALMDGGLVTNNWGTADVVGAASSSSYEAGGGGMLIRGSLLMTDGQVTHNEAAGGGGMSTVFWDGGVITIRGGIIAGNVARINEGGGVTVNLNGSATIVGTAGKPTYITNNRTETEHHWGGGGVFAADYSTLRMLSVVATANHAGGFGGGLAGCSTGRIDAHSLNIADHSIALYGNHAEGVHLSGDESTKSEDRIYAANDPVFMRKGNYFQDYFCALNTTVCSGMLGGGKAMWTGTVDGRPITPADVGVNERITSQYITGLTGNPSRGDINKALAKGLVFVTGNSSGTHGGGILCNGYMIIGTQSEIEIGDRMTIKGDKTVSGGTVSKDFTFIVTDGNGKQITTGTSQGDSEITFAGRIPFDKAGTYTFWIYEADSNNPKGLKMDKTRYRMVVTIESSSQTTSVPSATDPGVMETIQIIFNKISSVEIFKCADENDKTGVSVASYTNISSDNRNAYELPFTFEFVNRVTQDTGIVVSKTVHDQTGKSGNATFRFTVTLDDKTINGKKGDMDFRNGVATFTLKAGESRRAINLPANIHYTVTEAPADGYHTDNYTHSGTTVEEVTQSVVFENTAVGSLRIRKTVADEGATSVDKQRRFTFSIRLINGTSINGPYGPVIFKNGVAHVELAHGEEVTIPNLPAGTTYEVKEETTDGFDQNATTQNGTIAIGAASTAHFINTRRTGELHIKKYVIDSDYDGEKFEFVIELVDAAHINGKYGDATFTGGKATVYLKHGETVRITGLPTGMGYKVSEKLTGDAIGAYAVGVLGESSGTIGDTPSIVEYTNEKFAGLQISKDVSGTVIDRSKEFTFELTLTNDREPLANTYGGLTFVNGKATFTLKDGEYLILTGLPDGTQYTVKELNVDADIYNVQINGVRDEDYTISGELSSGDSAVAAFHNFRRAGQLELTKTTSSPVERDSERTFGFTVTLSEPLNAYLGDFQFVNGVAHVYLKHGQTLRATTLPAGLTYTIVEDPHADFDSTVTAGQASGTIEADQTSSVTFHNARRLGGLCIRKVVEGSAAGTNDVFGFRITLDRQLNGTFGEVTFTEGVATFELRNGEVIEISNLPEHTVYTITETTFDALRYRPQVGTIQGDIAYNDTAEVTFRNDVLGALTVSKAVEGIGADPDQTFTFTVTLSDKSISGIYGDMTFTDGVATFTLRHGESKSATRLPVGVTYTVTEAPDAAYSTAVPENASGTVTAHQTQQVSFVNTFITGGLEVQKTLAGDAANAEDIFTFTVTLDDKSISGVYGDMTFTGGVATFTLRGGEKAVATDLPAGIAYTVEEADSDYTVTVPANAQGTVAADAVARVEFINALYVQYGGLAVRKVVNDTDVDPAAEFVFTVTLGDKGINGVHGGMTFVDGVATFTLRAGETMLADMLPEGTTYTVTEGEHEFYNQVSAENASGVIARNETISVTYTNAHQRGGLTVTKTITGDGADMTEKFTFTVTLSDTGITGFYGDMYFASGVASFQLGHGESASATGLPAGVRYDVTETTGDYTMTSTGETGVIEASATVKAEFVNTKMLERGGLTVTKTITGDGADMSEKFTFTVTLSDTDITGFYGDMYFASGVASFQLGHGESASATGLPAGVRYSVTETANDYTMTSTGETGVIEANKTVKAEFVNTKMLERGGLTVTKTITGDGADMSEKFAFTVTLSDTGITGFYGDMYFASGVASFQLGHGESASATGLPAGVRYDVTETTGDYTMASTGETGVIEASATMKVEFVNTKMLERGGLTVTKTITGDGADMSEKFTFTVTLSDTGITGFYGDMYFASGVASFQLGHGESASATGLPAGVRYDVTETTGDYTMTSTGETGVIEANKTVKAEFVNTKMLERGGLTVTKTITGDGADMSELFPFTVMLSDVSISGLYGDMYFMNGVAVFELGHGESATATGLPAGVRYDVSEENGGYTVTSSGETGVIEASKTVKAEFVNTRMVERGHLTVSKSITGDAADMSARFTFRVTLDDAAINGVYGDMTFVNGVATFELGHAESATARKLPAGVGYHVEELDYADYEVTSSGETGVIGGNQTSFVTYINHRDQFDIPATGDRTPLALYVALMAISAGGLILLKRKTRRG